MEEISAIISLNLIQSDCGGLAERPQICEVPRQLKDSEVSPSDRWDYTCWGGVSAIPLPN
jgi:hypothetical protein